MMNRYTFWLWTAAIIQLATAFVHSLSFLSNPVPQNETERQLYDLMNTYKFDMGAGFHPSMGNLFTGLSACLSLLYLLGGLINMHLLQKRVAPEIIKGVTGINILVAGLSFLIMLNFTFLPPIALTGLAFISLCFAYATNHIHLINLKKD